MYLFMYIDNINKCASSFLDLSPPLIVLAPLRFAVCLSR